MRALISAVVHSTSVNSFVCGGPEAATNIVILCVLRQAFGAFGRSLGRWRRRPHYLIRVLICGPDKGAFYTVACIVYIHSMCIIKHYTRVETYVHMHPKCKSLHPFCSSSSCGRV